MTVTLEAVLAALESAGCKPKPLGSGYQALCPAHEDHNPSLCIKAGDTQPVVLRCHAGCRFEAITVALNLDRPMRVMDKAIDLPAPHKDVSDFIDAGGNVNVLADACKAAPEWGPSDAPAAPVARLEPITEFTPEPTPWVIPGWLAAGEFHLLAGQAGMGKSTLAMKIAAMVSRSQDFNGEPCAGGDVALWSGEDDYNKTLLPRLLVNGADQAHVHFVRTVDHGDDAQDFNPADHMPALAQALENKPGVRLVILDPILSIAAGVRDSYRPEDIRQCLLPVQALTRARGVAVLGITHFLKRHNATGSDPLDRVIGSQAWGAVARIVWAVDTLDDGGRGLMLAKSNLGPSAGGYTYQLVEEQLPTDDPNGQPVAGLKVRFPGRLAGEAADVFRTAATNPRDKDRETARDSAADWLKDYLSAHARPWDDVTATGKTEGFTEHTLRRARDMLKAAGIVNGKRGVTQAFVWHLVANESSSPREDG